MRALLLLLVVLVAALASAAAAPARPVKDGGIRLAAGVGPIALGTPRAVLERELGAGTKAHDWYGDVVRYPSRHVHVSYLVRTALRVGTTWPGYRTSKGIGPSSTLAALRRTYPHARCDRATAPFDRTCTVPAPSPEAGPGLTFFYLRRGIVREVDVWLVSGG